MPPKPPPMRGFMTRMRFTGSPSSGATMRRAWNGTCVERAQHQPLVLVEPADHDVRLDRAVCCCWTRNVCSKTCSAAAKAAAMRSSETVWPSMWWLLLWAAS